jgi:predicted metal-binding protein
MHWMSAATGTTIFICATCQRSDVVRGADEARSGETLLSLLQNAGGSHRIEAVSCMNNCLNACTVGFGADGKWTYVFGDVRPEQNIADILAIADFHAASEDGQIPWGKRPEALKRNTVSRTPPIRAISKSNQAA